jgi:hypothetical protein
LEGRNLLTCEIENSKLFKGKKILYRKDEEPENGKEYFNIKYNTKDFAKNKY